MVDRLILGALWLCIVAASAEGKPNLIIILADDVGAGDLGCYGADDVATPHIDSLAEEGIQFQALYSAAPLSSPARAGLLTGRIPARSGVPNEIYPVDLVGLPKAETTLSELLSGAGYATSFIGKWQLGSLESQLPPAHGFMDWYGIPHGWGAGVWPVGEAYQPEYSREPLPLIDNGKIVEEPVVLDGLSTRFTERAVEFIEKNKEAPFFLCLAPAGTDRPLYASKEFIAKSDRGLYGDCIEELDWSVGEVLKALKEAGIAEKTMLLFTSDNGPITGVARMEERRHGERGGGGRTSGLRGGRGTTYEGGMKVPGLLRYPNLALRGEDILQPVSHLDFLPTFLTLAKIDPPDDLLMDGIDIGTLLSGEAGKALEKREVVYYFGEQLQAIRRGKWKLFLPIQATPAKPESVVYSGEGSERFEADYPLREAALYDLTVDPAEENDLASEHQDVVEKLTALAVSIDTEMQAMSRSPEVADGDTPPVIGEIRRASADLAVPSSLVLEKGIVYSEPWGSPLSLDLYLPHPSPEQLTPEQVAEESEQVSEEEPPETVATEAEDMAAAGVLAVGPEPKPAGVPVVLLVHGGYWVAGKPQEMRPLAVRLCAAGFAVVCPSYRLADRERKSYPGAFNDLQTALVWLRENAESKGIDPERIFLAGSGVGGQLAALVGLQDPKISGVAVLGGNMDLAEEGMASRSREDAGYFTNQFLGADIVQAPELHAEASPITHLTKNSPAFLFVTGSEDRAGIRSASFRERCEALQVSAKLVQIEGGGREMWKEHPYITHTMSELVAFFSRVSVTLSP